MKALGRCLGVWRGISVGLIAGIVACSETNNAPNAPPDAGSVIDTAAKLPVLGEHLSIVEVSLFQGVKVSLVRDGEILTPNAPVVAGRPGLLRVYVSPLSAPDVRWSARKLDAELSILSGDSPPVVLKSSKTIRTESVERLLDSTFNFDIGAESVTTDATFSVSIRDATGAFTNEALSFPVDGTTAPLSAQRGTEELKIKLVPVRYIAEGGQRLSDTSTDQVELYRDTLFKMYPTAKVTVTVREPMTWDQQVLPNGDGWDELLMAIANVRASDHPTDDVYYIGSFATTTSLEKFCAQGGCVLGVAPLSSENDVSSRVALVAGYAGDRAAETMLQELAHAMGRDHAKCGGADRPDRKFPYPNAGIGVWGYDLVYKELVDPESNYDFMGYCAPVWISDYTYSALFTRLAYVRKRAGVRDERGMGGAGSGSAPPSAQSQKWQAIYLAPNGQARPGATMTLGTEPGEPIEVTGVVSGVAKSLRGRLVRFDNLPSSVLLLPAGTEKIERVQVRGLHGAPVAIHR